MKRMFEKREVQELIFLEIKLTSVSLFTAFSFYLMFYLLISPAKCTLMVIFFFEEHENINANRFCQKQ